MGDAMIGMIISIKDNCYISQLARENNRTYSWCSSIIQSLKRDGLVTSQMQGRTSLINLTDKGRTIKTNLVNMMGLLQ